MTGQKNVIEEPKEGLLNVHLAAKLHLSETEYHVLAVVARVNNRTIEDVINTILHRSIHAELEITVPKSYLLNRLKEENDKVFEEADQLEQASKDASEVEILTPISVKRTKYEQFRKVFDEQRWYDFVSWTVGGGGLLDEVIGENPSLMGDFLKTQNERLYGKKEVWRLGNGSIAENFNAKKDWAKRTKIGS